MDKLYNCEQISERYGVKINTVWGWIRDKKLPAMKIGKEYRVREADIVAFEQASRTGDKTAS